MSVKEAENRLAGLNAERAAILAQVEERVVRAELAEAARGREHSLEYVLNDAAFREIRRLEGGAASPAEKARLPEWRALAHRLHSLTEDEKRRHLVDIVREHAEDVGGRFNERVYRFARGVLPSLLTGLLAPEGLVHGLAALDLGRKIRIDGALDIVRHCASRGTLIVTPTHSSNFDSVVFGWALDRAGLPPVTYGAGKNLFSNPFLSFFMHNLGAYRVDRRLSHRLYKDVLKEYSTVLLERGFHSLFFPGGTRGRSGMVERHLKLGLLGTGLAAYKHHVCAGERHARIYVVPVTINYSIVLEAETLIDDFLADEGKHRYIIEDDEFRRLGRLAVYARNVLGREKNAVIRFGAPLDPFGHAVDEDGESLDSRGRRVDPARLLLGEDGRVADDPQRDAEYTRALGEELLGAFRRLTVLHPTHLVARSLFDRVAAAEGSRDIFRLLRLAIDAAVPVEEVRADVDRLRAHLAAHPEEGSVSPDFADAPAAEVLKEALAAFAAYHVRPVAERRGGHVHIGQMRLVYYYANRTARIGGLP